MEHIYAATVSLSESEFGGRVGIVLLCKDCNGKSCQAQAHIEVPPLAEGATPMEWLTASLGALAETVAEFDWTFQHDAQCEEATA